jgi:hypothetical protein
MPIGNWNLQWLNHNSQRSYPLTDWATKTDTRNTIRVPDSFLVALYLPISATNEVNAGQFFLKNLLISPAGFNVVIGYQPANNGDVVDVAAANIARASFSPNRSYALGGLDAFDDTIGHLVIGSLDEIDKLPPGYYEFTYTAGALEPDVIRPAIRGVSRLRVQNNGQSSAYIYGDVTLVAGSNIRISVAYTDEDTKVIFDAIDGANLNADCICPAPEDGECIRCINGVCSDDGTFTILPNPCIEIVPGSNSLTISDVCAQPCCGCAELEELNLQLDLFASGVTTLQNFVSRLGAEVSQMSLVVLSSRLNDTGCSAR